MNSTFRVFWSHSAERDLTGIISYIARDSVAAARDAFRTIREKAESLQHLPERGRVVPELMDQGIFLYRELIVPPWRLIYRASTSDVYVLAVLDSRQDIEDILLRRLVG